MASSYPGALDALTNPSATDTLDSATVPHHTQHSNANDAIEAIEATLGVNPQSSSATVADRLVLISSGMGVTFASSAPSNHDQLWADTSTVSAQVAVFDGGTPAAQLTSIKLRRGTTTQWNADPVLDAGEFGYNSTDNKFKIGNGTSAWSALPYVTAVADLNNATLTGNVTMTGATIVNGTISGGSA
jgi:hypothetical protein